MLRKMIGVVPVFDTVTFLGALVLPRFTFPKVKLTGEKLRFETAPTPLSWTMWGLPGALSVMVMAPVLVPTAVGLKVTSSRHAAEGVGESGLVQLFVWKKSPLATMLLMVTEDPLMLVTVIATGPPATFSD
jgi:hypothetical protein